MQDGAAVGGTIPRREQNLPQVFGVDGVLASNGSQAVVATDPAASQDYRVQQRGTTPMEITDCQANVPGLHAAPHVAQAEGIQNLVL